MIAILKDRTEYPIANFGLASYGGRNDFEAFFLKTIHHPTKTRKVRKDRGRANSMKTHKMKHETCFKMVPSFLAGFLVQQTSHQKESFDCAC
jgi:hypothetical protein